MFDYFVPVCSSRFILRRHSRFPSLLFDNTFYRSNEQPEAREAPGRFKFE